MLMIKLLQSIIKIFVGAKGINDEKTPLYKCEPQSIEIFVQ